MIFKISSCVPQFESQKFYWTLYFDNGQFAGESKPRYSSYKAAVKGAERVVEGIKNGHVKIG
jgi:hypothetical protein